MTNSSLDFRASRGVVAVGLLVMLLHIAVNLLTPFGIQRDEFLYMAMGEHLRWWRMDFPPFIALVSKLSRAALGDALWAVRFVPAICGGAIVAVTMRVAQRLSANAAPSSVRATWIAAFAVLCAPTFLRSAGMLQPVVFDQLWWTLALWGLVERERTNDLRWWWLIGAALGLGLLTKFSIAFIGVGVVFGVLLTPLRNDLRTRWPWLALVLALSIGAPSLSGQWLLDFPISWQMRDLQAEQLDRRHALVFLFEQPLQVGPPAFVLAMWGLWWLVSRGRAKAAAIAIVVCWLWLIWQHGKAYYGAPVYPVLLAAGAAAMLETTARTQRWLGPLFTATIVMLGVVAFPIALPVLSPAHTAAYVAKFEGAGATDTNYGTRLALPQDFADMLGWPQQAAAVAEEWRALSLAEQRVAVLTATNYGRAGALDFYGPRYGLPPVVSPVGSYWFFGPGTRDGELVISLGGTVRELSAVFERCRVLRTVGTSWGVEEERNVPIIRCDGTRQPLPQLWPMLHPARR